MKPLQQHSADQLEELLSSRTGQNSSAQLRPVVPNGVDAEVSEMVELAGRLQASPAVVVDTAFAQRLERKVLAHSVRYNTQTKATGRNWHWLFGRAPHIWVTLAALLFCVLAGTGTVIAMAASVSNSDNPLYGVKEWEQHVQLSLANSPQNKADVSLQNIRATLNAAASQADASHASTYHQTIEDIQQQFDTVSQMINTLPAGSDRQRLSSELATLKNDARHTLYSLLPKLPFTEQLATTTLLGHLGAPVPTIQQATVVVAGHHSGQARITITGTNLTRNTHLVINNQPVTGTCALQHNTCIFVIPWYNQGPPSAIAVLNSDDTTAQMTVITFAYAGSENGNSENNGDDGTNSTGKNTNGGDGNGHGHNNSSDGKKH